jgi:hypothetical protein
MEAMCDHLEIDSSCCTSVPANAGMISKLKHHQAQIPVAAKATRMLVNSMSTCSTVPGARSGGEEEEEEIIIPCRGEGSAAGLQLRVRFVPAALLAMLRTALALQCVSKARE